jgi:hypothetical protein
MGDMVSDGVNIGSMFQAGQSANAKALLALVCTNLAVQLLIVTHNYRGCGWRAVAWEAGLVLSLTKHGVDAARIGSGEEADGAVGTKLSPFAEMIACKLSELGFEAILGGMLQATFLLGGTSYPSTVAVVSVGLSCLSTSFTVTLLAFDIDLEMGNRENLPEFYGYIPDSSLGRVWTFVVLFVYHSAHVVGKTMTMALLALTNWRWLAAYMITDIGVFMAYKVARGDLIYWPRGFGIPHSVLARLLMKIIADFTGLDPLQTAPHS